MGVRGRLAAQPISMLIDDVMWVWFLLYEWVDDVVLQIYNLIGGAKILAQETTPHAHCCQTLFV